MEDPTGKKAKSFLNNVLYSIIALIACIVIVRYLSPIGVFLISSLYLAIHIYISNKEKGENKAGCILYTGIYVLIIIISLVSYFKDTKEISDYQYSLGYRAGYEEGYDTGYNEGYAEYEGSVFYSNDDDYDDGYLSALDFVLDSLPITETFTDEELEEFWEEYDTYYNYKFPVEEEEPLIWSGKTND